MAKESGKRVGGLRRRWIINTLGVVFSLGLVCVLAVTASYAAYYYSNMQSDLESRARTTTEFFSDYINQNISEFYRSCITYAETYEKRNTIELQFFDSQGNIVASSYGHWAGDHPPRRRLCRLSRPGMPRALWARTRLPGSGSLPCPDR